MKQILLFILLAFMPIYTLAQSEVIEKKPAPGWHGFIETGLSDKEVKTHLILSYPFLPTFSVGLGTGFHLNSGIPLFANMKAIFSEKTVAPFASFSAGCTLDLENDLEKGTLINTTIGIRIKRSVRTAFFLGIGYDVLTVSSNKMDSNVFYGNGYPGVSVNLSKERKDVGVFAVNMGFDF